MYPSGSLPTLRSQSALISENTKSNFSLQTVAVVKVFILGAQAQSGQTPHGLVRTSLQYFTVCI